MPYLILSTFRRVSLVLLLSVFVTGLAGADAPRTVDSVDLERYMCCIR